MKTKKTTKFAKICSIALSLWCYSTIAQSWTAQDLIITEKSILENKTELTKEDVRSDVDYLIYAMSHGYGGREFSDNKLANVLTKLQDVSGPMSAEDLRDKIDIILLEIPDNHLKARIKGTPSKKRLELNKNGNVGLNAISDREKIWEVRPMLVNAKRVLYISITKFAHGNDPVWNGFIPKAKRELAESSAAIIDLRGNGGGDDQKGKELASLFYGGTPAHAIKQFKSQTPETLAIFSNIFGFSIRKKVFENKEVPPHLKILHADALKNFQLAQEGKLPRVKIDDRIDGVKRVLANGFDKPIFILMDGPCGSSCESSIDFFEWHSKVKTVGENTSGYIHFGNVGPILLPNSRIEVQIPTHYNEYYDKRFIERSGLTPDVQVPIGTNALSYVIRHFL